MGGCHAYPGNALLSGGIVTSTAVVVFYTKMMFDADRLMPSVNIIYPDGTSV